MDSDPSRQPIENAEALLRGLVQRMLAAPAGAWTRVGRASAIVKGSVARSEVIPHEPSASFLADAAVKDLAEDGPGGRALFIDVIDVAVEHWLIGSGAATATGVWPSPSTLTEDTVTLPLIGASGIVLLDRLPATTLGRELALTVPGAYGVTPERPLILPDGDRGTSLAIAAARPGAPADAIAHAVTVARGGALQIALGAASRSRDAAVVAALRARLAAGPVDRDGLLVRATLALLGEIAAATVGVDLDALDTEALAQLGIAVVVDGRGHRALLGPDADAALRWGADDQ
jgi:hypothetical protein